MAGKVIKKIFKQGEIIALQGSSEQYFYSMQKGIIEILCAGKEYNGLDKTIILEHSNRVALISDKLFFRGFLDKTIRAVSDCELQQFSYKINDFSAFLKESSSQAIAFLNNLLRRLELSFSEMGKYIKLYQNLCRVSDNIALMIKEISAISLPEPLQKRAVQFHSNYKNNNGQFAAVIDAKFIIADHSVNIERSYQVNGTTPDAILNKELYSFLKRFLNLDPKICLSVFKNDPEMAVFIYNTISRYYNTILTRIDNIHKMINQEMTFLFGARNSWLQQLIDKEILSDWLKSSRVAPDFLKQIISVFMKFYGVYKELSGKEGEKIFSGLDKIKLFFTTRSKSAVAEAQSRPASEQAAGPVNSNIQRLYKNSLKQIFDFGVIEHDLQSRFIKALNEFKKQTSPFSGEPDSRKIRRLVTGLYWEIFTRIFLRSLSEKNVPPAVKLMLLYGYIDENLLDPGQVEVLHAYGEQKVSTEFPIIYEQEFLRKIFNEDEMPSINEMGITYEKYFRELNRYPSRKNKDRVQDSNEVIQRIKYEIANRLSSTSAICAGSRSLAFPIFTSFLLKGDPAKYLYSKSKLEGVIKELIELDYSVFYRETVLKLGAAREIIEEEVLPYFIFLPVYGTKVMMWQELEGINKRSRARIVIPVFFSGDIRKNLAHAFAVFRWELTRTTKGGMWADPVEGGLTGAYYDYVQFFKKNSKLSIEAKEKIAERLKGFRNNSREMFADDYISWVTYEKEGVMKMNTYVRDMFYRYIPFREKLRDRLEKMPAFRDSATRFKNIRNRTLKNYERRYKKYVDDNGNLPVAIQKYVDYLKM